MFIIPYKGNKKEYPSNSSDKLVCCQYAKALHFQEKIILKKNDFCIRIFE